MTSVPAVRGPRRVLPVLLFTAALLTAAPAGAQRAQDVPRPHLPDVADPNDWEAYFDYGAVRVSSHPDQAQDAFVWASRLDPSRAEPFYGRWVTFWAQDIYRFERALKGDERVLGAPDVIAADSLRLRALQLNPFVHQGQQVYLYDQLPGRWGDNEVTRGWIEYGKGHLQRAADRFSDVIARSPQKYGALRYELASALVNLGRYDSAAVQLDALLAQLRASDERDLVTEYQSKELLEYARGLLHLQGGRRAAAKEAFARSLTENPGFAPAHARLGELALAVNDTANALQSYATGVEVSPGDPLLRIGYGRALMRARRPGDAVIQLRRAIELAPYYADPYLYLGAALEGAGDRPGARTALVQFLARAPRNDPRRAEAAGTLATLPEGQE